MDIAARATALLNVTDDIFQAMEADKTFVLVLLNYSKTFDMVKSDDINRKLALNLATTP